jgi:hypothetical protein
MEKTKKKIKPLDIKSSDLKAEMTSEIQRTVIPRFILRSVELFLERRNIDFRVYNVGCLPEGSRIDCDFAGRTMRNSVICVESHVGNLIEIAEKLWHIPQDEIC